VIIEQFPESDQAQDARVKLGLSKKVTSDEMASRLFASAEKKLFDSSEIQYAMSDYQRIVDDYPETEYAPKAMYALGWINERMVGDVEGALEIYQGIINQYPNSEYTEALTKKLDTYERSVQEQQAQAEALAKARADSLQALAAQTNGTDSTAVDSLAATGLGLMTGQVDSLAGNGHTAVQVAVADSVAGSGQTNQDTRPDTSFANQNAKPDTSIAKQNAKPDTSSVKQNTKQLESGKDKAQATKREIPEEVRGERKPPSERPQIQEER
jgi:tetratricopeptide (TPR) repeat protein